MKNIILNNFTSTLAEIQRIRLKLLLSDKSENLLCNCKTKFLGNLFINTGSFLSLLTSKMLLSIPNIQIPEEIKQLFDDDDVNIADDYLIRNNYYLLATIDDISKKLLLFFYSIFSDCDRKFEKKAKKVSDQVCTELKQDNKIDLIDSKMKLLSKLFINYIDTYVLGSYNLILNCENISDEILTDSQNKINEVKLRNEKFCCFTDCPTSCPVHQYLSNVNAQEQLYLVIDSGCDDFERSDIAIDLVRKYHKKWQQVKVVIDTRLLKSESMNDETIQKLSRLINKAKTALNPDLVELKIGKQILSKLSIT